VDVLRALPADARLLDAEPIGGRMAIAVMLCDDHPAFARGLAKLLETEAPDLEVVGVATSAEEIEQLVRESLPDVVLMDIRMPGTDGIEATRRIRRGSPTTKVVMLTVSDEQADLYEALRAGASGYVRKDDDVAQIVNVARAVQRGHLAIPADLVGDVLHDLEHVDAGCLSDAERDILAGIGRGETNRDLASRLHLSERTVRRRVEDIYSKLHLADRLQAAVYANQRGLGGPRAHGREAGGR
jgi:two-component system, NarL family, response regulator LiaR